MKIKGRSTRKVWWMAAALVVVTALAAGQASAAMVSYDYVITSQANPFTVNFTLNMFDTNLGTLTGINLYTMTDVTGNISIYNTTGSPQTFTNAFAAVPITVTPPSPASAVTTTATANVASGNVGAGNGPYTFNGITASSFQNTAIAPANFSLFEVSGGGLVSFSASAGAGTYGGTALPGVFFGGTSNAGGEVTIDYTYTPAPVPLPGAMLLFAPGLAGLAAIRRKFKG